MRSILIILVASLAVVSGRGLAVGQAPAPMPEEVMLAQIPAPPQLVNPALPIPTPLTPATLAPGTSLPAQTPREERIMARRREILSSDFRMIGDQSPILSVQQIPSPFPPPSPPTLPSPRQSSSFVSSVRGVKISENQSPQPQDRVFYTFNFFADVNQALNKRFSSQVAGLRVYREVLGFEKTFNDGYGSIGLRESLNTVSANSTLSGNFRKLAGTSTSLGDLNVFGKYIIAEDPDTGNLISVGLSFSLPTGPGNFGGAKYLANLHSTTIQPFVGYLWSRNRFYLHGFSALDTPTTIREATLVYNDVGVGYFLLRQTDPGAWLTAVAPTLEVHVNTPLTHRNPFNPNDPGGVPDVVNLTYGLNFEFNHRSVLTFGLVTPVTGPRPFDYEAIILFNLRFRGTRRNPRSTPTMIGG